MDLKKENMCQKYTNKSSKVEKIAHTKTEKGITLIALVVTIIVLLILAGVTINMALGDNGIFEKAKESQEKMNEAVKKDMEGINELTNLLDSYINEIGSNGGSSSSGNTENEKNTIGEETTDPEEDGEKISKEESYVGYYADIDGDGTVDGVIYADLLIGGSGTWGVSNLGGNGTYNITKISNAKNYTISQESYEGKFGTKPVLKGISKSGNNRFYVMALNDLDSSVHYWYYSAYSYTMSDYATATSKSFGKGKANTATMIEKWNNKSYGSKNGDSSYTDVWGIVQEKYEDGWFVPSANEWAAFGSAFNITTGNYGGTYGLSYNYWSSSQFSSARAYFAYFNFGCMGTYNVGNGYCVCLSATF